MVELERELQVLGAIEGVSGVKEFPKGRWDTRDYSFMMRGRGRVAMARYSCWCPACCLAHDTGEGMDATLKIAECKRGHLSRFEEHTISSSIPADRGAVQR